MHRFLIVYASKHGHTAKIAGRVASRLRDHGAAATERAIGEVGAPELTHYDAVIVGGSIHAGHYDAHLVEWCKRRASALESMPSAFFSVCLTAAEDTPASRDATQGYLDQFAEETGWLPAHQTTFAGALQYLEYDFMTRLLMRLLMHKGHHPTDASRDYDYTDWTAVDAFADQCARMVDRERAAELAVERAGTEIQNYS